MVANVANAYANPATMPPPLVYPCAGDDRLSEQKSGYARLTRVGYMNTRLRRSREADSPPPCQITTPKQTLQQTKLNMTEPDRLLNSTASNPNLRTFDPAR